MLVLKYPQILKPSLHCQKTARTATQVLWQVTQSLHYRDKYTFDKIYKTNVRPHLEFVSPCWLPWMEHDILKLEKVQEQFVMMVSVLKCHIYRDRLTELQLLSLSLKDRTQKAVFRSTGDI